KFLIDRWKKIPGEIRASLNALKKQIAEQVPGEDPDQLVGGIQVMLGDFLDEVKEAIDTSITSGDGNYAQALKVIADMKTRVAQDELIQMLKENGLGKSVPVDEVLLSALTEIENNLAA